jgi:hypothetical protein
MAPTTTILALGPFPKCINFKKSVEKYKSCGPKAKIVVVGAILNYSAFL